MADGLVKTGRGNTQDLVQIILDSIDDEFGPAATVGHSGDDAMGNDVLTAAHAHRATNQRQRQVVRQGLIPKPGRRELVPS